ncbi:hypothetical protein BKK47_05435 [Rodentibacter mrazii]|uniref:Uncharacterized protein n=1 Tax=Rodentibacter mrazii TaxID=1908257 RepID=A0A1V3IH79_9PAST|nr:hypothetical protein [Rodentibacter mrazii]OOF39977.1 hypothetical protein BKK47_05435 [Rodentibacter mrazii]
MWLQNILRKRMPFPHFHSRGILNTSHIKGITIYPKRTSFAYQLERIESDLPLFKAWDGTDYLGRGKIELQSEIDLSNINLVIPSIHQSIENKVFLEFYVNLKTYNRSFYSIRLHFKSEYFPFKWGKLIDIPVQM